MTRRYDTPGVLRKREQARSTRPREVCPPPRTPSRPQSRSRIGSPCAAYSKETTNVS